MQALKLEAVAGLRWVVGGLRVFRAQPFSLMALLFLSWLLLLCASAIVDWIAAGVATTLPAGAAEFVGWLGRLVIALFTPALTVGFQQGCRVASAGLPVQATLLFAPFRAGRRTLVRLLILGAVQVVALACIVAVATRTEAFRQEPAPASAGVATSNEAGSKPAGSPAAAGVDGKPAAPFGQHGR